MRVLFDQATPVPIRQFLAGRAVRTAAQEGWDKFSNGELLAAAEAAAFDVLLADNLKRLIENLAGIIIGAGLNRQVDDALLFGLQINHHGTSISSSRIILHQVQFDPA